MDDITVVVYGGVSEGGRYFMMPSLYPFVMYAAH